MSESVERKRAVVRNRQGIHCRPSGEIARALADYQGSVRVIAASGECDPRSVMALMTLELTAGTEVEVEVQGPDAARICAETAALLETEFDFPTQD